MNYIGLADCHGIESFIPEAEAKTILFGLKMRATVNRQKHAVIYKVDVSDDTVKIINELLEKCKYKEALNVLKAVPNVEIMKEAGMAKSWRMIPNDDLDPFSD